MTYNTGYLWHGHCCLSDLSGLGYWSVVCLVHGHF